MQRSIICLLGANQMKWTAGLFHLHRFKVKQRLQIDSLNQSEAIHPPIHSTTSSYLSRLITSDSHSGINDHQSCSLSVSLYTAG